MLKQNKPPEIVYHLSLDPVVPSLAGVCGVSRLASMVSRISPSAVPFLPAPILLVLPTQSLATLAYPTNALESSTYSSVKNSPFLSFPVFPSNWLVSRVLISQGVRYGRRGLREVERLFPGHDPGMDTVHESGWDRKGTSGHGATTS